MQRTASRLRWATATFLFRCPYIESKGWIADDGVADTDNTYEPVSCYACRRVHPVNPNTGKVTSGRTVRPALGSGRLRPEWTIFGLAHTTELSHDRKYGREVPRRGAAASQLVAVGVGHVARIVLYGCLLDATTPYI